MNNTLAVTISPKDRVVDYVLRKIKNPLRAVYDDDITIIRRALNRCSRDYTIYPELDITGRLHYHGTVNVHNMMNWKTVTCNTLKTIGFINVKTNVNKGWETYCTKEWTETMKILEIYEPITYEPLKRGVKKQTKECESLKKTIFDYLN